MSDAEGRFKMTAVDQRPPIKNLIKERRQLDEAPWDDVAAVKRILIEELQEQSSAMLLDPHYAYPGGVSVYNPAKGLVLTLEDSIFNESSEGRLSAEIDDWSVEKIKRIGGDGVKLLCWYRPDAAPKLCRKQQDFAQRVGEACVKYDLAFVFELLVYPLQKDEQNTAYLKARKPELVLESARIFSDPKFAIDLFKFESPLAVEDVPGVGADDWKRAQTYFDTLGEVSGRPWVMLSAGVSKSEFLKILSHAYTAGASGYLAGRAIWWDAFQRFPDLEGIRAALRDEAVSYMHNLNTLTDESALPWHQHGCFNQNGLKFTPADSTLRYAYPTFGK